LEGRQATVGPIIIRTRYFDDFLKRAIPEAGLRQVAVLGPGLDTRAFRLGWPAELRWFELDQPDVLAYKQAVLEAEGAQPTCQYTVVGVDLGAEWSETLLVHGFDPQTPALWLLEGLLFYLPDETITRILHQVNNLAAPGSMLAFDIINHITLTSPLTRAWIEM
jgi:methyltransferase (TIGR00027 family)